MKQTFSRSLIWLLLLFLVVTAGIGIRWQQFLQTPLSVPPKGVYYTLAPGTSAANFISDLTNRGITHSPRFLSILLRLQSQGSTIQAGDYFFGPNTTPTLLVRKVLKGDIIHYQLRLGEGWTFSQIRQAVDAEPRLIHTLKGLSDDAVMTRLGHPQVHPEGLFFPDTYEVTTRMTDVQFLTRAYTAMNKKLQDEWAQRATHLPYQNAYQALIVASLVEKETAVARERPIIAGILLKRLQQNIRLQVDPTVIYGLGTRYNGTLTYQHLRENTPYNTYVHAGLPPTPIASVGQLSLQAALHPVATPWLYYVAKGDGSGHMFSATLAEHNKAVQHYRASRDALAKVRNLTASVCMQGEDKLWRNPMTGKEECLLAWKVLKGLAKQLKCHLLMNTCAPTTSTLLPPVNPVAHL